jgi:5-methylcytosine-specific restriction endonuclease McrA
VASVLQRPTLVLNRNWQAIHVASVQRALVMMCNGVARAVDTHDFQVHTWDQWLELPVGPEHAVVRGVSCVIRAPEVITLCTFDRLPCGKVPFSKRNVFKRDRFTCQYCGLQPGAEELTIDHILPRSQGGESSWENCVLACVDCNRKKADLPLKKAGMRLRSAPRMPVWRPLYTARGSRLPSWANFLTDAADGLAIA